MPKALVLVAVFFATVAQAQSPDDVARWTVEAYGGDAVAQSWLGAAYESGRGTVQDFGKAQEWLERAAQQGDADAMFLLGQMHEDGEGVPEDYVQAANWYRKACEQRPDYGGAGNGCNSLGLLYLNGLGVKKNALEAYKYFLVSRSPVNLKWAKIRLTKDEIAQAEHEAQRWFELHPDPAKTP